MEITTGSVGECPCDSNTRKNIDQHFVLVITDIDDLIKRCENLTDLLITNCNKENIQGYTVYNGFVNGIVENSIQDNYGLKLKIFALQEAIKQVLESDESFLEEVNKQRKRNGFEELPRNLVECKDQNKKLISQVVTLEKEKIALESIASFWRQNGGELSRRHDQQASKIEDIIKDTAVFKPVMEIVMKLTDKYPAPEKQAGSPCMVIKNVLSNTMNLICKFESAVKEKLSGFLHDIDQIAQANSSLETKCRRLEQELETISEEKASLVMRHVSERKNLEVELLALQECCKCSDRQLAAVEASRLAHEKSLTEQFHLEEKLKTAEVQVNQLQEELGEERRRLSEQITTIEEKNKLLDKAKKKQQKNARKAETFEKKITQLESREKSTIYDLQATEEKLSACQNEIEQLVGALEMRNKMVRQLEEETIALNMEQDKHLDSIAFLKKELEHIFVSLQNETQSKDKIIDHLHEEVAKLKKDRVYTQVAMGIPPPEVTNKEQSSAEIAQDTVGHLSSGSNLVDYGAYRYEKIISDLEAKIKIMVSSHHKEIENLNRVNMKNKLELKKVFEREKSKDRKMHEGVLGKQQKNHEQQINELKLEAVEKALNLLKTEVMGIKQPSGSEKK